MLDGLCRKILEARANAVFYITDADLVQYQTAAVSYFMQIADFIGLPVIVWTADMTGLPSVSCSHYWTREYKLHSLVLLAIRLIVAIYDVFLNLHTTTTTTTTTTNNNKLHAQLIARLNRIRQLAPRLTFLRFSHQTLRADESFELLHGSSQIVVLKSKVSK